MYASLVRFVKAFPHWAVAFIAIGLVSFYWFVWAEERYVSRATVVLESPQVATPDISFASLLGSGGSGNTHDLLLLREHLLSVDMLRHLDEQLGIRQHYSEHGDFFAKLRDPDVPIEDLHKYYLRRVEVELDEYAGVLNIHVQGYTPEFARDMTALLLDAGENHMNEMGHRLADEQVRFLEQQMVRLEERFEETRAQLLEFQNEYGISLIPKPGKRKYHAVVLAVPHQEITIMGSKNLKEFCKTPDGIFFDLKGYFHSSESDMRL